VFRFGALNALQAGFQRVERDDLEGVMIKHVDAPYVLGRHASWVKWKRDYGESWDVDCLLVGGMYGADGVAGGLTKYICALAAPPGAGRGRPFITFARASSGLSV
jgi:ATP-dependent DNA ligase